MITFTGIGAEHTTGHKPEWLAAFQKLEWLDIPTTLPMMQGEGIKGLVRGFNLPPPIRVAHAAVSLRELDGCGLLATEHKTPSQHFRVFALDDGASVTPLAMETLI